MGANVRFSFVLVSTTSRKQELVVDYVVHFVKASGVTRPKIFKLKRLHLAAGTSVELGGRVYFAHMTTRRA